MKKLSLIELGVISGGNGTCTCSNSANKFVAASEHECRNQCAPDGYDYQTSMSLIDLACYAIVGGVLITLGVIGVVAQCRRCQAAKMRRTPVSDVLEVPAVAVTSLPLPTVPVFVPPV